MDFPVSNEMRAAFHGRQEGGALQNVPFCGAPFHGGAARSPAYFIPAVSAGSAETEPLFPGGVL